MKSGPVAMIVAVICLMLWLRTLGYIISSDNMRITKFLLFFFIVSFPPAGIIYPLLPMLGSIVKHEVKGAPKRLEEAGASAAKTAAWFFKKQV
jgi:hypothetical protein